MNEEGVSQGPLESADAEASELRRHEAHEIYKGIGRNIVLLQQMEEMLRYLAVNTNISSAHGSLVEQQRLRQKWWKNRNMGDLVQDYGKQILAEGTGHQKDDDGHISIGFHLSTPDEAQTERKKLLRRIVEKRNKLVHRLPVDWTSGSPAGYELLRAWLDKLWHELVPEWDLLRNQVRAFQEAGKLFLEQMETGFFDLDQSGQLAWYRSRGIPVEPAGE